MAGSGIGLAVILAAATAWLQFSTLDGYLPGAQQALAERLNAPVAMASLRYVLLPTPRLVLESVAIGKTEGVRAKRIEAHILPFALFVDTKRFNLVEVHGLTLHPSVIGTLPAWTGARSASALHVDRLRLTEVTLDIPKSTLGAFNGDVRFEHNGAFQRAVFGQDKAKLELDPHSDGVRATFDATAWRLPFGPAVEFEYLSLKGVLRPARTGTGVFTARFAGGSMEGTVTANWSGTMGLEGEFKLGGAQLQDLARALMPEFSAKGTLKAPGRYAMQGPAEAAALPNLQAEATFQVTRGELTNIDLVRGMQSPGGRCVSRRPHRFR